MAGLGGGATNTVNLSQTIGSNINNDQLTKLVDDNAKLKDMVQKLLEQGVPVNAAATMTIGRGGGGYAGGAG